MEKANWSYVALPESSRFRITSFRTCPTRYSRHNAPDVGLIAGDLPPLTVNGTDQVKSH